MRDFYTDYQLALESIESLDEESIQSLGEESIQSLDKESIGDMIEFSRWLQRLPASQIQAFVKRRPRSFSSPQVATMTAYRLAIERVVETKGLQEEWEKYTTESINVLKKLYRWEKSTKQMRGVSLLARYLWQEDFDGWLGDLQEARWELIDAGYSWWRVRLITWGRIALLFWSLIQVRYQDLSL